MEQHKRDEQPDFYVANNPEEQARLEWATEKAHLTLWYYRERLAQPEPDQVHFSAKAHLRDGDKSEHIWLTNTSFDEEGNLYGELGNDPVFVKNVRFGQRVGVPAADVSDWMIVRKNGRLIGGYTIRAIRDGITDETELHAFDESVGLVIDAGEDYFRPDFFTPEGAILCLQDSYDRRDLEAACAARDFTSEAIIYLSANYPDQELTDVLVSKTSEVFRLLFSKAFGEVCEKVHFGSFRHAFPIRKQLTDGLMQVVQFLYNPDTKQQFIDRFHVAQQPDGSWRVAAVIEK